MTSLQVAGLSKRFGPLNVGLHEVNLSVASGELLVLLGPSGSGKTTLLRCIAGLIEPSTGIVRLGDRAIADCNTGVHLPTHKRGLGMVFQSFALWSHMSVRENVAYPLKSHKAPIVGVNARVEEVLRLVHCTDLAERLPSTLSGGQQQRVALARALAAAPALLLFDEPLSNLDALLRIELRTQLRAIHRETGFTGVYVTHDQVEALSLGSRVAVMNGGRVEQIGTPQEIYRQPATEFVAQFMGMSNRMPVDDGSAMIVRFRPEAVAMQPAGAASRDDGEALLAIPDAEIIDRAFTGECFEYGLMAGTRPLKARVVARSSAPQIGERVDVIVARDGAAFFPGSDGVSP